VQCRVLRIEGNKVDLSLRPGRTHNGNNLEATAEDDLPQEGEVNYAAPRADDVDTI